ncbi:hypothetical protein J6590_063343 [Homalodisca vitripennis]|nr:hypothetical protein J6590_063343 [Homalodisca vitripennis]
MHDELQRAVVYASIVRDDQVRYIIISPQTVRPGMLYNVLTMFMHDELQRAVVYASIVRDDQVRYIIISPQTVRPGMLYNVLTMFMHDELQRAVVYASIVRDDQVLAEGSLDISTNTLSALPLKLIQSGQYSGFTGPGKDIRPRALSGPSTRTVRDMVPSKRPLAMSILPGSYTLNVEGRNNGMVLFHNSSALSFDSRFLAVVVQTSRPIYRAGQEVRFRVVALHTNLRPFNDGLEVYVLDPDGVIMRRWISAYTNNGVSSLRFKLPKLAKDGYWKIRIKAWNQIEEQVIKVETYFDPLFEVHVILPPYIAETEDVISGSVYGLYTSQRYVDGNGTLMISARRLANNETFVMLREETIFFKGAPHTVEIPMSLIHSRMGSARDVELRLEVEITELLSRETVKGYSHSRIIPGQLQLRFLSASPATFKPGLPFYGYVSLDQDTIIICLSAK